MTVYKRCKEYWQILDTGNCVFILKCQKIRIFNPSEERLRGIRNFFRSSASAEGGLWDFGFGFTLKRSYPDEQRHPGDRQDHAENKEIFPSKMIYQDPGHCIAEGAGNR